MLQPDFNGDSDNETEIDEAKLWVDLNIKAYNYAKKWKSSEADIEDLAQKSLEKLFQAAVKGTLDMSKKLDYYLKRIVGNLARDEFRKEYYKKTTNSGEIIRAQRTVPVDELIHNADWFATQETIMLYHETEPAELRNPEQIIIESEEVEWHKKLLQIILEAYCQILSSKEQEILIAYLAEAARPEREGSSNYGVAKAVASALNIKPNQVNVSMKRIRQKFNNWVMLQNDYREDLRYYLEIFQKGKNKK